MKLSSSYLGDWGENIDCVISQINSEKPASQAKLLEDQRRSLKHFECVQSGLSILAVGLKNPKISAACWTSLYFLLLKIPDGFPSCLLVIPLNPKLFAASSPANPARHYACWRLAFAPIHLPSGQYGSCHRPVAGWEDITHQGSKRPRAPRFR